MAEYPTEEHDQHPTDEHERPQSEEAGHPTGEATPAVNTPQAGEGGDEAHDAAAEKAATEHSRSRSPPAPPSHGEDAAAADANRSPSAPRSPGGADANGHADAAETRMLNGAHAPIVVKRRPTPRKTGAGARSRSDSPSHEAEPLVPHDHDAYDDADDDAEGREDYAANAAEMAAIRAEMAQLEEDERTIEERLQLYSEVIAQRKELQIVQEDEERLRAQRDNTEKIVAAHDPEINKEVAVLEDEAQQSVLQNIWKEESAIHNPDKMDWATIDIANLGPRVAASRRTFTEASERAEALHADQAARINAHTDSRERTKEGLRESYEEEMANLDDARARLRQVKYEVRYHQHRGTTRGRDPVVGKQKVQYNRERRVDHAEVRTTRQVEQMSSQLTDLMEECKVLKKQLDESRRLSSERQRELETQLQGVEEEGQEAREFKERLEREREELVALKTDLQGVLHYVRAKNREEEDF